MKKRRLSGDAVLLKTARKRRKIDPKLQQIKKLFRDAPADFESKNYEKATPQFNQILSLDKNHATALCFLGAISDMDPDGLHVAFNYFTRSAELGNMVNILIFGRGINFSI